METIVIKPQINKESLIKIIQQNPNIRSLKDDIVWSVDVKGENILLNAISFRL